MLKKPFCRIATVYILLFCSLFSTAAHAEPLEEKTIYLTYDDGPCEFTEDFLTLLDEYDAKATFFLVGSCIDMYPQLPAKIKNGGHSIGVHCNVHDYHKLYSSEKNYLDDLDSAMEKIKNCTGQQPDILRFPGGSVTARAFTENRIEGGFEKLEAEISGLGLKFYDWNISADSGNDGVVGALKRIKLCSELENTMIILMHDSRHKCLDITRAILEWGINEGYRFKSIDSSVPICCPVNNFVQ